MNTDIEFETGFEEITETAELISTTQRPTNPPGDYPLNNAGSSNWVMFYYLFVVFLIIGVLIFMRKYLLKKVAGAAANVKSGKYMKILDRLVIAQDRQIILIEIVPGGKIMLLGVGSQRIETLAEFPKEEFKDILDDINNNNSNNPDAGSFGGNFLSLLGKKLNIKDGGKNEG
ncbi:MAG: flagellar biosynthetic protein FliO [Oscillospiraceae bacterium]|nr:flagellar biosynthetic protein FliO [Oscillospiraceae bacterium]